MNTVSCALNQGREVFAVPGRIGTACAEGPLAILREGARIITCADDILEDLGLKSIGTNPKKRQCSYTPPQQAIAAALQNGPLSVEEITAVTAIGTDDLLPEITLMEMEGMLIRENGNRYRLPIG